MNKVLGLAAIVLALGSASVAPCVLAGSESPAEIPATWGSAGRGGIVAARSVVRISCSGSGPAGTGFLHKSGRVITAAHVVADCPGATVIGAEGRPIKVKSVAADAERDLALLSLETPLAAEALPLSATDSLPIGLQVSTWGFPFGYTGAAPLLCVGYLSGVDYRKTKSGMIVREWVVNAAFNQGNSGGPLIDIANGEVIGIVSSKLSPTPPIVENAMETLSKSTAGPVHVVTLPDGKKENVPEGQMVALALRYLRDQAQLVVGKAVPAGDLRAFLASRGIEP